MCLHILDARVTSPRGLESRRSGIWGTGPIRVFQHRPRTQSLGTAAFACYIPPSDPRSGARDPAARACRCSPRFDGSLGSEAQYTSTRLLRVLHSGGAPGYT